MLKSLCRGQVIWTDQKQGLDLNAQVSSFLNPDQQKKVLKNTPGRKIKSYRENLTKQY